jgi:hypothetical protein
VHKLSLKRHKYLKITKIKMDLSAVHNLANDPLQQTERLLGFLNERISERKNLDLERLHCLLDIAQAIRDFAGPQIADSLAKSTIVEELIRKIPKVSNPRDACILFSKMTVLFASLEKREKASFYHEHAKTNFNKLPTESVRGNDELTDFQMLSVLPFFACAQAVVGEKEAAQSNFSKAVKLSLALQSHPVSQSMTLKRITFFQLRAGFTETAIQTANLMPDLGLRNQALVELNKPARFANFKELLNFLNVRLRRLKIKLPNLGVD